MEEQFSPQQSLELIKVMVMKTRENIAGNRVYFLFWGWFTFSCILIQLFLKVVLLWEYHFLIWLLTIPAFIITILYTIRRKRFQPVRTYIGDSMGYLWTGISISLIVLSFVISFSSTGWNYSYPFFILMYGLGTYVSGKLIRFRPLIIGGIIDWFLACASVYFSFDYQLLFGALALLISYIIPGHLLGKIDKK